MTPCTLEAPLSRVKPDLQSHNSHYFPHRAYHYPPMRSERANKAQPTTKVSYADHERMPPFRCDPTR